MPSGGYRAGAGLKKGFKYKSTIEKEATRKVIFDFVSKRITKILNALYERSQGVTVEKINAQGQAKVYDLPPDPESARILIEHAVGKAQQNVAVGGEGEDGEIVVKLVSFKNGDSPTPQV